MPSFFDFFLRWQPLLLLIAILGVVLGGFLSLDPSYRPGRMTVRGDVPVFEPVSSLNTLTNPFTCYAVQFKLWHETGSNEARGPCGLEVQSSEFVSRQCDLYQTAHQAALLPLAVPLVLWLLLLVYGWKTINSLHLKIQGFEKEVRKRGGEKSSLLKPTSVIGRRNLFCYFFRFRGAQVVDSSRKSSFIYFGFDEELPKAGESIVMKSLGTTWGGERVYGSRFIPQIQII